MTNIAYRCPLSQEQQADRSEAIKRALDSLSESDYANLIAAYERMNERLASERGKKNIGFGFHSFAELAFELYRKGYLK